MSIKNLSEDPYKNIEKRLKVFRTVDLSKAELKSELDHLDVTKGAFDSGKVRSTILTPRAVQFLRTSETLQVCL